MVTSLDGTWLLAADPENTGRDEGWYQAPVSEAVEVRVPWVIQDAFPGYHGVAWYWREFNTPVNPDPGGRCLLRFWAVSYLGEVWVNGQRVGAHEGGETPFTMDVTDVVRVGEGNLIAVRVLNPTEAPIDGIAFKEVPNQTATMQPVAGRPYNQGGIMDSVELITAPAVRVDDLLVRPDLDGGVARVAVRVVNAHPDACGAELRFSIASATGGERLAHTVRERSLPPGVTVVEADLEVPQVHRWDIADPYLYTVTVSVLACDPATVDEASVRCGFRDFRVQGGSFRLNGRRIFLRSTLSLNACPIGYVVPHSPDLFRRDLINLKAMGFNCVRFIACMARRDQLDLADEIGLMIHEECAAAWGLWTPPHMSKRWDRATSKMMTRDRNHASVVIWGLLNETEDDPIFRHAVEFLPRLRELDDTRLVLLNSGRWDLHQNIGSLANPGSTEWDYEIGLEATDAPDQDRIYSDAYFRQTGDMHVYPRVPHRAEDIMLLRKAGSETRGTFISEYGIGSAIDLVRVTRHFEQLGAEYAGDAQFYRGRLDAFMDDWKRWRMADTFASPEEYFRLCLAKMAGQRLLGIGALRANPHCIGYGLTGAVDQAFTADGLTTTFRELKPGAVDALFDVHSPLRLCLFVEPVNAYLGSSARLEAVLANEDALKPGEYPLRLQVVGPHSTRVFERTVTVTVPDRHSSPEPPFAFPVFSEDVTVDGPAGEYQFLASFERGAAAAGGRTTFYLGEPVIEVAVDVPVVIWGEEDAMTAWLRSRGVDVRPFTAAEQPAREVILCGAKPPAEGAFEAYKALAEHVMRGSTVIFLNRDLFGGIPVPGTEEGKRPFPLVAGCTPHIIGGWLYVKDEWTAEHPIFEGLPSGGLMDYTFWREIIPDELWRCAEAPDEVVAAAIKTSQDYDSGLMVSVHRCGTGHVILSTLRIVENLGQHPAADRLLGNMISYAASEAVAEPADLPADFEVQFSALAGLPMER